MESELALFGGPPVMSRPLEPLNGMGGEEEAAVTRVIRSGCLSGFYGSWGNEFFGGPAVRELESSWADRFRTGHAVSVNSGTSGLYAAMAAAGVAPGDEVIVPPFTMSATVMAPMVYGGVPVFVDIDPATFCLDPERVLAEITGRTRAIIAVNLFGHPAPLADLRAVADEHGLVLVEDNAQAPFATEHGRYCGTVGHIGVFSLNFHKHIQAGEGGVCVTADGELALRLQLVRNHAESVVGELGGANADLVGFNYRMTELTAAIALEQLKKADHLVSRRVALAEELTRAATDLGGLSPPVTRDGCEHVQYLWALRVDPAELGTSRHAFSRALAAEGFPHFPGYVRPLYLLPVIQRRLGGAGRQRYERGLCPVTEEAYEQLLCFEVCMYEVSAQEAELLGVALQKVHGARGALASVEVA